VTTVVLMSGGVDSSVALMRLIDQERSDLTACYLKIWLEDELAFMGRCPWEEDLAFVRIICEREGVPLRVVSLQHAYHDRVVAYALSELRAGRTPSPDVMCNRLIKFGAFMETVSEDVERVASGHYAGVLRDVPGGPHLVRGSDPVKDQTYFLCRMTTAQIRRAEFPIGGLAKAEVRRLARRYALPNADRPDSQGICFLGRIPYDEFVRHHLGDEPGPIIDVESGRELGRHRGLWFHTIGQRRGLGLAGGPWYVVGKRRDDRAVLVTHGDRLPSHGRRRLVATDMNWIGEPPAGDRFDVRLRHGQRLCPARVEGVGGDTVTITMDEGDPGVASGQFAVVYDRERCLGGGPVADV
jgi:tRNA (5-methylaminomethyl-2-thiouridylate)-methyltransferase